MEPEIKLISCPVCSSKNFSRFGVKRNKLQSHQKYKCKNCCKIFTLQTQAKDKTYPINIILSAVSYYNLGYRQTEITALISKRFKLKPSQKTISNWLKDYRGICSFQKLRNLSTKLYSPETIIEKYALLHNNLPYKFQVHRAKLYLLFHNILYNNQFHNTSSFYEPLKQYLEKIPTDKFPHHIFNYHQGSPNAEIARKDIFNNAKINNNAISVTEKRASQLKFNHLKIEVKAKNNFACKLAKLALNLAPSSQKRHQSIQDFMLINDSTTIATEIPIYLTNWDVGYYRNQKGFIFPLSNYKMPITGHIDLLQIRNGLIHILDYKPEADKIKPIEQITIYALALSRKLNLPLYFFKCAWFDEKNYYEFFPLHAVYQKRKV